jgi:hypothetical protein
VFLKLKRGLVHIHVFKYITEYSQRHSQTLLMLVPVKWELRTLVKVALIAGHQWLTPVILATQEAEIRRIAV